MSAPRTAGLFDIRFIIGGLIGLYGVILTLMGIFNDTRSEIAQADGININLWAGLGMLAFGLFMGAWGHLRPVIVTDDVPADPAE